MTQDNIYAYSHFTVIGGHDYQGEDASSLRIFASYEAALDYARVILFDGFDYAYVMGVGADGVPDLANVLRVAEEVHVGTVDLR